MNLRKICELILYRRSEHFKKYKTEYQTELKTNILKEVNIIDSSFIEKNELLFDMLTNLSKEVNVQMLDVVIDMYEKLEKGEKTLEEAGSIVNEKLNNDYILSKIK